MRALLLSNSTQHGHEFLAHADSWFADCFRDLAKGTEVVFVPYALKDHDAYAQKAAIAFERMGYGCRSLHRESDPAATARAAKAFYVGGGNTFRLLKTMQGLGLIDAVRDAVAGGACYTGASAGTNVATPTIRTTNDMPIVEPQSFESLGFVSFQINPHYLDPDPGSTHMGETREQRLAEFHEENTTPVLGLREGCALQIDGEGSAAIQLLGQKSARVFVPGEASEWEPGSACPGVLSTAR